MNKLKAALKKRYVNQLIGLIALVVVVAITVTITLVNNDENASKAETTREIDNSVQNNYNKKEIEKSLDSKADMEESDIVDYYVLSDEAMRLEILERYETFLNSKPTIEVGTEALNLLTANVKEDVEGYRDEAGNIVKQESLEPTVQYESPTTDYSDADYDALLRIVEAEATSEDIIGKIMVANVVINRVNSSGFPNNMYDVIHQTTDGVYQFSPIQDGRYFTVPVTESTIEAVSRALSGEDYANKALFFVARSMASDNAVSWFDRNLEKVAVYGVHEFFAYPSE